MKTSKDISGNRQVTVNIQLLNNNAKEIIERTKQQFYDEHSIKMPNSVAIVTVLNSMSAITQEEQQSETELVNTSTNRKETSTNIKNRGKQKLTE